MALTQAQLSVLATEIAQDPQGLGYAGQSDSQVADLMALPRVGFTVRRDNIMPAELLEAIDVRDFDNASITPASLSWFESLTQLRAVRLVNDDNSNTRVLGNLRRMLQNPSPQLTRERLDALSSRAGTRAEEILGRNVTVTYTDVGLARALGN